MKFGINRIGIVTSSAYTYIQKHTHTYPHIYTHTHTHAHIHTHIHTNIHAYTQKIFSATRSVEKYDF